LAESHFKRISEHFYERIQRHPNAHAALEGPEQIERLKRTLVMWMRSGLEGPHDELFYERRCRIGRVHVRIDLPQQYMFTAMNVMRLDFRAVADLVYRHDLDTGRKVNAALDKLFDLELAIMLETYRQDSDDRLRRKERLATVGQLASNIAHDLRNPLGVIESSLFIMRRRNVDDERIARHLDKIGGQVNLCGKIISNLLELARSREPRREPVDPHDLFDQALLGIQVPADIRIERNVADGVRLSGDFGLLAQAMTNLIDNSIAAHERKAGSVYLRASARSGEVTLEAADDGPGFDPEVLSRVFEPLVTTRHTGIGLGLALVKNITERHGGRVEAGNRPEGGAYVRMILPIVDTEEAVS